MKKNVLIQLLVFFVVALVTSCSKHHEIITPPNNTDSTGNVTDTLPFAVYIGGSITDSAGNQIGALWINDSLVKLPDFGRVSAIQVSGGDIYLTGYGRPFYLKNGKKIHLAGASYIDDICVVGKNVYASGIDSNYTNRYWINDTIYTIEGTGPDLGYFDQDKIIVKNDNVYVSGGLYGNDAGVIWKNGKPTIFYPQMTSIMSMFFKDDTLYVGGYMYPYSKVAYFRNDQEIDIDNNETSSGNHITYTPSGIAIAYMDGNGQIFVNINGINTPLHFNEFALTSFGNDVYVAGEDLTTWNIMLWKNGSLKELPYQGAVSCIYVK